MKSLHTTFHRFFLTGLLLCLSMLGRAEIWTVDNLPMVHLQDARRYVCNPDGLLSQTVVDSLDLMLYNLEKSRGVQTVVVMAKRIENGDAYRFAIDLGNKQGVGLKSQNTGLVVVVAAEDRNYFISTGRGLEGTLPDVVCARVERRLMVPMMKEGNWDAAVGNGVAALVRYMEGDDTLLPEDNDAETDAEALAALAFMALVFILFCLFAYYNSLRKCSRCGKRRMYLKNERIVRRNGKARLLRTWHCMACGHEEETEDDPPSGRGETLGRSGIPFIIGSGSPFGGNGGGGFGGGFGGGSFGGGSFGGGGAGGSF